MKSTVLALTLAAFAVGVSAPAIAAVISTASTTVSQQDKCKEGEQWNEEKKACEKKPE